MRIAVCSDEPYPVNEVIAKELERRGHEVVRFGSLANGEEMLWAEVTHAAARAVATGDCDEGVFFCWTGTGASMAANKVPGIRAALCVDPETATGARVWNHANVLAMSNRLTTPERAQEVLDAWLATAPDDPRGAQGVEAVRAIERQTDGR